MVVLETKNIAKFVSEIMTFTWKQVDNRMNCYGNRLHVIINTRIRMFYKEPFKKVFKQWAQSQQGSQLASCRAVFCAGFHVVTSTTHGVHMDTTWHPCGNPVVSCRNHIVSTFETLCCPPGNHIVSTWKPNGVHLETTWCAHGNPIISTWQPCSVHRNYIVSVWKPYGGHMETMWFSHGNYVVSIFESMYCPPGNHMVSTWKLGGVHLDTIWC